MSALGFADPAFESQAAFRAILKAIASPGAIEACGKGLAPPPPLAPAAAAAILTLADFETPLWIAPSLAANGEAVAYLKFHTGVLNAASPDEAAFALIDLRMGRPRPEQLRPRRAGISGPLDHNCRADAIADPTIGLEDFGSRRARRGGN